MNLFFSLLLCFATGSFGQLDIVTDDTPLALRGACISNPCLHNGLCTITPSGFICTCLNGHVGVRCERRADDCPRDNAMNCMHGICKLDLKGQPYCVCNDGFDGPTCSLSINNCASQPCKNGASCIDKTNGFECKCLPETYGSHCQIKEEKLQSCLSSCSGYPNDGKCWHDQNDNITVGWGYGDLICNSKQTCFNTSKGYHDPYEFIEVQLKPVHMPLNDELIFITDRDAVLYDYHFVPHILPMEAASEESFLKCNTTNAVPLTNNPKISRLDVNGSLLKLGTQYFLADTNTLHRCLFGLRLNVTVKDKDCVDPSDSMQQVCQGHGKCFSDFTRTQYECLCCDGYAGEYCQYEDPCFVQPCANNAVCKILDYGSGVIKHQCVCPTGFHGKSCSRVVDFCSSAPCKNGAACYTELNGYRCQCKNGFSGKNCEVNLDECVSSPCKSNGTCIDGLNNFQCQCLPGHKGTLCEIDINECAHQPCINGTCLDLVNNYTCACRAGYTGRHCEIQLNECESQPCVNGKCIKKEKGFLCSCGIGHTGMLCELKLNLCQHSQFCIMRQAKTCVDLGNNVTCVCVDGWTGDNCAVNKDDCVNHKCVNNGKCIDKVNGYECKCKKGYSGLYCEAAPPKIIPDIEIGFMTDNCRKFQDSQEVHRLEKNVVALLRSACKCDLSVTSLKFGSTRVECKDDMAGNFMADLAVEDVAYRRKVVCGMQQTIMNENTPNIYHNTYLVSIVDNEKLCKDKETRNVPKAKGGSSRSTGVVVGVLFAFILLIAVLVFVRMKLKNTRRKVGVEIKFPRETISFDNAAYGKGDDKCDETLNQSSLDETSFMSNVTNDMIFEDDKWAHSYDRARKLYDRNTRVPAGRLFDIHNPAGPSTQI